MKVKFKLLIISVQVVCFLIGSDAIPKRADLIEGVLDNGLSYYILENSKPEARAELRLVVNVGSVDEDDDQQGFAHLIEHMCFNGTEKYPKSSLVEYLESLGMAFGPDLNAYTSFDETVYMLQIPTDDEDKFRSAIEILSEWAFFATLDDEELDKEKGVVVEEWRRRRGARSRILDEQFPVLFEGSKYANRLPIGKMDIIQNTSNERIKDFYNKWYKPHNMSIIAVGDFDAQYVKNLIYKFFDNVVNEKRVLPKEYMVPNHKKPRVIVSTDSEAQYNSATISFKTNVMKQLYVNDYSEDLKEKLLFDVINKRLEEVSKGNESPFINAYTYHANTYVDSKEFTIIRVVTEANKLNDGISGVMREIERINKFGISSAELERSIAMTSAKKEVSFNDKENMESRKLARELVSHFLINEPIPGIEWEFNTALELYKTFDVNKINEVLPVYFPKSSMVVQVTIPDKEGVLIPSADELLSAAIDININELTDYVDATPTRDLVSEMPIDGTIVSESYNDYIGVYDILLSNGIRVSVKNTDYKNDEILFNGYAKGGSSLAKPDDYYNSSLAVDIIEESGYADFSNIELSKLLSGKMTQVRPYINSNSHGFKGKSTPNDLETTFQLLYTKFTKPNYDIESFTNLINRYKVFVENRNTNPDVIWGTKVDKINYSNHYSKKQWDADLLETINHMKSYSIYKELFSSPKNFHFIFVGNIDIDRFKEKKICAFAGIGNPSNFFHLLKENNINVKKTYSFPDHYNYSENDFSKIIGDKNMKIITTEKDYFRMNDRQKQNCEFVKVDLEIENKSEFVNLIKNKV